jgi:hypothetical protein
VSYDPPYAVTAKNIDGFDHSEEKSFKNGKLAPSRSFSFGAFDRGNRKE